MEFFNPCVLLKTNIMEANQILQSDILDIIFEGKNKSYGAYDLRKTYNGRISLALLLMFSLIGLFIAGAALTRKDNFAKVVIPMISNDTKVHALPPDPAPPIPPLPPETLKPLEKISTVHFATLKIAIDDEVMATPPSMDEIEKSRIDLETFKGVDDLGLTPPPPGEPGTQVFAAPVSKKDDADGIKTFVEIEAAFPGGLKKWSQYIQRAILNELDEFNDGDYGTCIVKFIVDKTGKVSAVEATTMKGTKLAQVAVNAIRKGPNWIPAEQNGRKVNAYRLQPVTLKKP